VFKTEQLFSHIGIGWGAQASWSADQTRPDKRGLGFILADRPLYQPLPHKDAPLERMQDQDNLPRRP